MEAFFGKSMEEIACYVPEREAACFVFSHEDAFQSKNSFLEMDQNFSNKPIHIFVPTTYCT